ncbi:MAG TPA: site-2 protease family protein [Gammaproteobacteria bacterium]
MPPIDIASVLYDLSVAAVPILFAITLHEVAHGWIAKLFGDPTAQFAGRLTLNPLKHVDPIGTVVLPIVLLFLGGPIFGWAKPVPVSFANLRNPRRDMILVAAAGPGSNLLMALGWALLAAVQLSVLQIGGAIGDWIVDACTVGILINVILAVFNMLPIPPLDGGRVLAGLLPPSGARVLNQIEPFGILIVLVLLMTVLWQVIEPAILFFNDFFVSIAGIYGN